MSTIPAPDQKVRSKLMLAIVILVTIAGCFAIPLQIFFPDLIFLLIVICLLFSLLTYYIMNKFWPWNIRTAAMFSIIIAIAAGAYNILITSLLIGEKVLEDLSFGSVMNIRFLDPEALMNPVLMFFLLLCIFNFCFVYKWLSEKRELRDFRWYAIPIIVFLLIWASSEWIAINTVEWLVRANADKLYELSYGSVNASNYTIR